MGFYEVYDAARNPLAWQKMAGQQVAVTGGRSFGIAQQRFNGQVMTLMQLSGKSDFDLIDCFLATESTSTAATFKKGDPVTLAGMRFEEVSSRIFAPRPLKEFPIGPLSGTCGR